MSEPEAHPAVVSGTETRTAEIDKSTAAAPTPVAVTEQLPVQAGTVDPTPTGEQAQRVASSSRPPKRRREEQEVEPLEDIFHRRTTTIKEGDNVLLRLPSDAIKAVVASQHGLVQLGKYGAFPCSQLLGLHYDITYEIHRSDEMVSEEPEAAASASGSRPFGQSVGKKSKKKKGGDPDQTQSGGNKSNPGWKNSLRPLKRRPIVDAVIDDIQETNEFIDDDSARADLLSHEEIAELRAQGVTAEEMIKKQMERHENFGLKTDFSKEKWRIRKEKKFSQTVHPLAPSVPNITTHYAQRAPSSILHLREDTMSQLLSLANVRPGGRYLIVDDTGGLVTAAVMDKMGCVGRILSFTDIDGPPAWGVLQVMNWSEREMSCVKSLNWMEAEEDYQRPLPPDEDGLPSISAAKTQQRMRKHNAQVAELNGVRNDLFSGNWDGLILATDLSPISVLARLTQYIIGSGTITVYSPYLQISVETLAWAKKDHNYLGEVLSESWTRTYQVLPGRTHPMMSTSATGGYLFHALRVFPSSFEPDSHQRAKRRGKKQVKAKTETDAAAADPTSAVDAPIAGEGADEVETAETDDAMVEAEVAVDEEMEVEVD